MHHAILIAGGGPTGMMLAAELALAGVDAAIVERRPTQELAGSRGGGLHSRTLEILDQRGIADRFISQGQIHHLIYFHTTAFDISKMPSRHNHLLGLWQNHTERILAEWVEELKVPIYRAREVTGFTQDDHGVDVQISNGETLRAKYLVGCDGGRSLIRKAAGIDFPGWDATTSWLIAEAEMRDQPELGMRQDAHGVYGIGRVEYEIRDGKIIYKDSGPVRLTFTEHDIRSGEPTLDDIREVLVAAYGTDFGIHSPTWISRFTDMARQAAAYREKRVLLAGDAAHVHAPMGGQGLNIGVQDAMNLGWKLAQVVKGISPETLLDTYHAERHPVAARVLRNTMAHVAFRRTDERTKAWSQYICEFLSMDEPRQTLAAEMSGLGVHYNLGEGHPLLGRRMPDLDLDTTNGPLRVFSLLHHARPLLLNLGDRGAFNIAPWSDRVQLVDAKYEGPWELPAIGTVHAPSAVLIRPDGYIAWVGEQSHDSLAEALTTWFGPPVRA